jgi:heme exporter protein B
LSSSWVNDTATVLRKEALSEVRGKHGVFTTLLFAVMTVTALGVASARGNPTPTLAAGMLWVALLFAAITGLSRTFILEEEQGTGDLLRTWSQPGPVFWGKSLYNFLLLIVVAAVVIPMFVLFLGVRVVDFGLMLSALVFGCAALTAAISLCGALASRSSSRGALAGVISIPVLIPVVMIGVGAIRVAFGDAGSEGWSSVAGLAGIALVFGSAGPYLFAAVWRQ